MITSQHINKPVVATKPNGGEREGILAAVSKDGTRAFIQHQYDEKRKFNPNIQEWPVESVRLKDEAEQ